MGVRKRCRLVTSKVFRAALGGLSRGCDLGYSPLGTSNAREQVGPCWTPIPRVELGLDPNPLNRLPFEDRVGLLEHEKTGLMDWGGFWQFTQIILAMRSN